MRQLCIGLAQLRAARTFDFSFIHIVHSVDSHTNCSLSASSCKVLVNLSVNKAVQFA